MSTWMSQVLHLASGFSYVGRELLHLDVDLTPQDTGLQAGSALPCPTPPPSCYPSQTCSRFYQFEPSLVSESTNCNCPAIDTPSIFHSRQPCLHDCTGFGFCLVNSVSHSGHLSMLIRSKVGTGRMVVLLIRHGYVLSTALSQWKRRCSIIVSCCAQESADATQSQQVLPGCTFPC